MSVNYLVGVVERAGPNFTTEDLSQHHNTSEQCDLHLSVGTNSEVVVGLEARLVASVTVGLEAMTETTMLEALTEASVVAGAVEAMVLHAVGVVESVVMLSTVGVEGSDTVVTLHTSGVGVRYASLVEVVATGSRVVGTTDADLAMAGVSSVASGTVVRVVRGDVDVLAVVAVEAMSTVRTMRAALGADVAVVAVRTVRTVYASMMTVSTVSTVCVRADMVNLVDALSAMTMESTMMRNGVRSTAKTSEDDRERKITGLSSMYIPRTRGRSRRALGQDRSSKENSSEKSGERLGEHVEDIKRYEWI